MGRPALFVRLYGCPVRCPWCDSAGTWHAGYLPPDILCLGAAEIAEIGKQSGSKVVVITGGEPAIHDLNDLVRECHRAWLTVHLETSGGFRIKGPIDWMTLSPKKWKPPLPANLNLANEFKIIVEQPDDIKLYCDMIKLEDLRKDARSVWLHPEWSKREDPVVLRAIVDAVKAFGGKLRAGWQIHKLYQVDRLDPGSRVPVPLGGDPSKGF